ncbi:MAG: hypothetical protein IKQ25_07245 [Lachnospiraceae bacterium]|nr:hypothetical protein [Lachnospiraceae bacterium]
MKKKSVLLLNLLIVAFTLFGLGVMLYLNGKDSGLLSSAGWENLKYFTVQSNILCGIVALIYLVRHLVILPRQHSEKKERMQEIQSANDGPTAKWLRNVPCPQWLMTLKLAAAAAVTVTFLVVACFFGPLYGYRYMYLGSNLWFHLIIPVLGMVEFCLLDGQLPFKRTFFAGSPALIYGCFYLGNILINGKGEWPNTNDWYGFMNWGMGIALVIFAVIIIVNWGVACLLRAMSRRVSENTSP